MLDLAILGLLKEQPLHGYELRKRLGEALGSLWGISYGSLYPALRRLERDGRDRDRRTRRRRRPDPGHRFARRRPRGGAASARAPKASRRTRKAYRITERGNARFEELLARRRRAATTSAPSR